MAKKNTANLLDNFFEYDMNMNTTAADDKKMDADERDLRVLINAHAKEERRADEIKAKEAQQRARHRARVKACYRRLTCCTISALAAYILTRIGAVSPVTALIITIAALVWMAPELYWIARKTIRFWTREEGKHRA